MSRPPITPYNPPHSTTPSRSASASRPSSRTPSRAPSLPPPFIPSASPGAPARLIPPVLHSAPSLSSLKVYTRSTTPLSGSPPNALDPIDSVGTLVGMMASSGEGVQSQDEMLGSVEDSEEEEEDDDDDEGTGTIRGVGMFVAQDVEPEVEPVSVVASGQTAGGGSNPEDKTDVHGSGEDDDAKKLRAHLRRTLSMSRTVGGDGSTQIPTRVRLADTDVQDTAINVPMTTQTFSPRQYFVLTDAGKPVFISNQSPTPDPTSTIGLMQALISIFLDDGDKLRCVNAGRTRIAFILRPPLYYACVSDWGEPESVVRSHLEYLHLQILSVVSAEQLRRMFERRNNFDLRRLLSGAEPLLYSLLDRLEWDMAMATSSLHTLKLEPALRRSIAESLVPTSKIKDILYVVLVAQGQVITLVRPKKHSIHPSDLHILINTIHSPSIMNSSAAASWLPICLPKFNPAAFVNAYVTFLKRTTGEKPIDSPTTSPGHEQGLGQAQSQTEMQFRQQQDRRGGDEIRNADTVGVDESQSASQVDGDTTPPLPPRPVQVSSSPKALRTLNQKEKQPEAAVEIGLVCVCGLADFEAIRGWCDTITEKLSITGTLNALTSAISRGKTDYFVSDLSVPGLRHFVYKSRSLVQITFPVFEEPYDKPDEKRRLCTLYQTIHDAIHAKSGQESTLKLQYVRTEYESVMGWITQPFELYLTMSPLLPKSAVVHAANAIAKWVKREEKRLFLLDAPVF